MNLPFFRSKTITDLFLGIDIGTYSVKIGTFQLDEGGVAHLIGFGEKRHSLGQIKGGRITDSLGVAKNIMEAAVISTEMAGVKTDVAVVGVSGEICHGSTTVVRLKRMNSGLPITFDELDQMDLKVSLAAKSEAESVLAQEFGLMEVEVDVLSTSVTNYKIDGRTVHDPIGETGDTVDVYCYTSFLLASDMTKIHDTVKKSKLQTVITTANIYALNQALCRENPDQSHFILVDCGGEQTTVAVVIEGGIVAQASFPIGGNALTRSIMHDFEIDFEEAEGRKIEFADGEIFDDEATEIRRSVSAALKLWVASLEMSLTEMEEMQTFPHKVLLTGGGAQFPLFEQALNKINWTQSLHMSGDVEIKLVTEKQLIGVANDLTDLTAGMIVTMSLGIIGGDVTNL